VAGVAIVAALAATAAVFAGASSGGVAGAKKTQVNTSVSGNVSFDGIWTAAEQTAFEKVIKAFNKQYPKVKVNYNPVGDNLPTVLATDVAAGHPPDMADIAQPGLMKQFAQQHALKPITYAKKTVQKNFGSAWVKLGSVGNKLYAVVYKAANKSTLWYNVADFKQAGISKPKTWKQLLKDASTLKAAGIPAWSLCGASGWTLTDIFENIYLRTFGPAKYDALTVHKIKWTDKTVTKALTEMKQIIGDSSNLTGGRTGALQTSWPTCVDLAFGSPSKGAMVPEADFVGGVILTDTNSKPGTGFNAVPFPTITSNKADSSAVEIGGDLMVTFRNTPAIQAFETYLASAKAAKIWAHIGGFGTGNKGVPASVYPDSITRATEAPIGKAKSVVFDMSDEQKAGFGSTAGQGEWGLFQKFLQNPNDIKSIQQQLEAAWKAAQ
jgi:alpha-glucoside transport system substrate-binding protein